MLLQLASGHHQAVHCVQAWQAVAQGEATLNNTLLGFLGRFDAPFRAQAPATASRGPSGTQGRRLHQNDNSYLVQGGQLHSHTVNACISSHCQSLMSDIRVRHEGMLAGLGVASLFQDQLLMLDWHSDIFGEAFSHVYGHCCWLVGQISAKASAAFVSCPCCSAPLLHTQ